MIAPIDMHVHLLAGLDDGPKSMEDAVEMCRILYSEGVRSSVALAHQNPQYPDVTPDKIRSSTQELKDALRQQEIPLLIYPSAEIMIDSDIEENWAKQHYLTVADHGQYVLLELPNQIYLDIRWVVEYFIEQGVRPILAHAERTPEWLLEPGIIEELISMGCVVQVSTTSITRPKDRRSHEALKSWFQRGMVHLLGSDGHSPLRRRPEFAEAIQTLNRWIGPSMVDRVACLNANMILQGKLIQLPPIRPYEPKTWFARLWSGTQV